MEPVSLFDIHNSKIHPKQNREHNYNPKAEINSSLFDQLLLDLNDPNKYKVTKNTLLKYSIEKYKYLKRLYKIGKIPDKLEIYVFISKIVSDLFEFKYVFNSSSFLSHLKSFSDKFYDNLKNKKTKEDIYKYLYSFINEHIQWPENIKISEIFNSFFKHCYIIFKYKYKDIFFKHDAISVGLKTSPKDKIVLLFLYYFLDTKEAENFSKNILLWFMTYFDANISSPEPLFDNMMGLMINFNNNSQSKFEFNLFMNKFIIKCNLFTPEQMFEAINVSGIGVNEYFWEVISEFVCFIMRKDSYKKTDEFMKFLESFLNTFIKRKELIIDFRELNSISLISKFNPEEVYKFTTSYLCNINSNSTEKETRKFLYILSYLLATGKFKLNVNEKFLDSLSQYLNITRTNIKNFIEEIKKGTEDFCMNPKEETKMYENIYNSASAILQKYLNFGNTSFLNNSNKITQSNTSEIIMNNTSLNSNEFTVKKRIQELIQFSSGKFKTTEEVYQTIILNINNDPSLSISKSSVPFILKTYLGSRIRNILLGLNKQILNSSKALQEIKFEKILLDILTKYFDNLEKENFSYSNIVLKIQICFTLNIIMLLYKNNYHKLDNENINVYIQIVDDLIKNCLKSIYVEANKIKNFNEKENLNYSKNKNYSSTCQFTESHNKSNVLPSSIVNNNLCEETSNINPNNNYINIINTNTNNETSINHMMYSNDFSECYKQSCDNTKEEVNTSNQTNFIFEQENSSQSKSELMNITGNNYLNNSMNYLQENSNVSEIKNFQIAGESCASNLISIEDGLSKNSCLSGLISLGGYTDILSMNTSEYEEEINNILSYFESLNNLEEIKEKFICYKKAIEELGYLKEHLGNNNFDAFAWLKDETQGQTELYQNRFLYYFLVSN